MIDGFIGLDFDLSEKYSIFAEKYSIYFNQAKTMEKDKLLEEFYETHKEQVNETLGKETKEIDGITYVVLDCTIEEFAGKNGLTNISDVVWKR